MRLSPESFMPSFVVHHFSIVIAYHQKFVHKGTAL